MENSKYPPVLLMPDRAERLKSVPVQAWWADEDEPWVDVGPEDQGMGPCLPYRVALKYGLVEVRK